MTKDHFRTIKPATPPTKPRKGKKYNTRGKDRPIKDNQSYGNYAFVFTGEIRGLVDDGFERPGKKVN